jgi:hypothetical protein
MNYYFSITLVFYSSKIYLSEFFLCAEYCFLNVVSKEEKIDLLQNYVPISFKW